MLNADLGQHPKVIEYYDQALELYQDFRELYHNMTRTFEEMENYSKAIIALEKLRLLYLEILPRTNPQIVNIEQDIIGLKQKQTQTINVIHPRLPEEKHHSNDF